MQKSQYTHHNIDITIYTKWFKTTGSKLKRTSLEREPATIESIKIRVCHFKVKSAEVRRVEGRAADLVASCLSHAREICVDWQVGSFGLQIRGRACAEVAHGGWRGGPPHQQIHCPHCLGIADGAVTQTGHWMCAPFVIFCTGRIPACSCEKTHDFRKSLPKKQKQSNMFSRSCLLFSGKRRLLAVTARPCCWRVESVGLCPGFALAPGRAALCRVAPGVAYKDSQAAKSSVAKETAKLRFASDSYGVSFRWDHHPLLTCFTFLSTASHWLECDKQITLSTEIPTSINSSCR